MKPTDTITPDMINVERVQDISQEDARAEGMKHPGAILWAETDAGRIDGFRMAFMAAWDEIYGNWYENPWVWCCEFKRVDGED